MQLSSASHVRVMVVGQVRPLLTSLKVTVIAPGSQESVAVTTSGVGSSVMHPMLNVGAGVPTSVGGV